MCLALVGCPEDTADDEPSPPDAVEDANNPDSTQGTDTTDPEETTDPPEPGCAQYCALVNNACTGDNAQYEGESSCITWCVEVAHFPAGAAGDTTGNTVGCRMVHAEAATADDDAAAEHCPNAGPTGAGVCGTWCENLCHLDTYLCSNYQADTCADVCAAVPSDGQLGDTTGDTVQCRLQHLIASSSVSPKPAEEHCPNAALDGGDACVDTPSPSCEEYCESVHSACTGDNAQYPDQAACLAYCASHAALEPGAAGDTSGDTIACRTYHATIAGSEDPALHCAHAGPSGGDVCGTWCEVYCGLAGKNCTLFDDDEACLAACAAYATDGTPGDTAGDAVQCRIYHLGVAGDEGSGGAATHCPHGGPDGGGMCVGEPPAAPTCEAYCETLVANCPGEHAQFAGGKEACLDYCTGWATLPVGTLEDTAGNTVGCRLYHAGAAADDPATHCVHAGPSGGDTCGTWCENYCHLAQTNCVAGDALFDDLDACQVACADLETDGPPGAAAGDSVQCRIYHLGAAGSGPGASSLHCPHGGIDGAGVCVVPEPPAVDGETCEVAIPVGALPWSHTGDTAGFQDDYAYTDGACPPEAGGWGTPAPDVVFVFTPAESGWYRLSLSDKPDFDANLYVVTDCADVDNTCVAGDEDIGDDALETVVTPLVGGETYFVIVDGWGANAAGAYTLNVEDHTLAEPPTCAYYCSLVGAACVGENAQYASDEACLEYCETWAALPAGTSADTAGNTVGCRTYHADVAADGAPEVHCPHAGPSGGDVCGSWCDVYCDLASANCTGTNALYADAAACDAACGGFATDGPPGALIGDDVQCRIYHLGVAGSDGAASAAVHCPHGAVDGGGVCVAPPAGDTCGDPVIVGALPFSHAGDTSGPTSTPDYAYEAGECAGETNGFGGASSDDAFQLVAPSAGDYIVTLNADYDSNLYAVTDCDDIAATCLGADEQIGAGQMETLTLSLAEGQTVFIIVDGWSNFSDVGGAYTLEVAKKVTEELTCAFYCQEVQAACAGANAQYASVGDCVEYCETWGKLPLGALSDTSGNTVGCRISHALAALDDPAANCLPAGPTGGDQCGSWCDNLCHLATTNCTGANAQYADTATCLAACASEPTGGSVGDTSGASAQCKIYHLGVAGSDGETSAAVHCPHGGPDGGGVCVTAVGETCEDAIAVGALPWSYSGDTTDYAADYSYAPGECPGESSGWGGASPDVAFAFTPETTGSYIVSLTGTDFDSNLYVVTDCGDISGSCLAADEDICSDCTESLTLGLTGGATVYIIADGYGNFAGGTAGAFELAVEKVETLSCLNYCGTVQAACQGANAQYADVDACVAYCEIWAQLPVGTESDTEGNTVGCRLYHAGVAASGGDDSADVHCGHAGPHGGGVCGSWCDVYCDLADLNCGGELSLYADAAECATACAGLAAGGAGGETFGDTVQCRIYHLGVAGSAGDESATVHCPHGAADGGGVCVAPAQGETCADPFPIGALPFTQAGDTTGALANYAFSAGACPGEDGGWGAGSSDHVYAWTATTDGAIEVTLTTSGLDSALYVVTDCGAVDASCLAADDEICSECSESVLVSVSEGVTYLVIVDGYDNIGDESGAYELSVSPVDPLSCPAYCLSVQAACTGENAQYASLDSCLDYCETWATLPLGAASDTAGNTVGCRIYHAGAAATDPAAAALHCPHAGPTGGNVCGTWCENLCHLADTNCTGDNAAYTDAGACSAACATLASDGEGGAVSGDTVQCRIYHLGVAGSDGDTSAAIHCPHGAADGGGVCVAPALGDTCGDPFVVGSLPFSATGDTDGFSSDYGYSAGACPGETGGWGAASSDHAYAFTPAEDGELTITLSGFDSNLYVVTDCGDVDGTCVAGDEEIGSAATETVTVELTGGVTYYVIVDGWGNFSNATGAYTLTIE